MSEQPNLTEGELAEIKARAEKATAGPWEVDGRRIVSRRANRACDLVIAEAFGPSRDFIAHSRTDVIRLLDSISSYRAEIERLTAALKAMGMKLISAEAQLSLATRIERERILTDMATHKIEKEDNPYALGWNDAVRIIAQSIENDNG